MASRFPPSNFLPSTAPEQLPECEVCGQRSDATESDLAEAFARRFELVHSSQGPRVRESYLCAECGTAFLVGAKVRAALAEEDG